MPRVLWNFSNIGGTAASRTQDVQKETALPNFTVGQMKVENGTATVSDLPLTGSPFVYSKLNLSVEQFSFAKAFPFELTASLPAGGDLEVKGNAGPINQKDASETPLGANVSLKHFDPVAAGVLAKSQGVSMLADITAQVTSNGQILNSNGTVHAANLQLVPNGSPTPSPVDLKYTIEHNLEARAGQISDLNVNTGGVAVHVGGDLSDQRTPNGSGASPRSAEPPHQPGRGPLTGGPVFACLAAPACREALSLPTSISQDPPAAQLSAGLFRWTTPGWQGFDLSSKIGGAQAGFRR